MKEKPEALKKLINDSKTKHTPRGQIIFHVEDDPKEAFIIQEGVVKIYDIDEWGNEKILHLIGPGGVLPFAVFSGFQYPIKWFYAALTDCDLYRIPHTDLQDTMQRDSATAIFLMNWFSIEVHELLVRLDSLGRTNVRDKLLAALKFLVVRHSREGDEGWSRVNFPVSHQLLADMTGITRESAATAMKELTDAGAVRSPRLTVLEIRMDRLINYSL